MPKAVDLWDQMTEAQKKPVNVLSRQVSRSQRMGGMSLAAERQEA